MHRQSDWRAVVQQAVAWGLPVPGLAVSLAYYDAYRRERLPANLTQAQRDFFGSHTYERLDAPAHFTPSGRDPEEPIAIPNFYDACVKGGSQTRP